MGDTVVRLSFPAKADYLLLARLALTGVLRHRDVDETELGDLKLAITEACGNVVRHAYAGDDAGTIDVAFILGEDRLVMIVEDQGSGVGGAAGAGHFDPASPELLESGMGMAIIRAIVDEHEFADGTDGRGTVVRMTKFLRTTAG